MSSEWLDIHQKNYKRLEIEKYFTNLLAKIEHGFKQNSKNEKILELGAGSGNLSNLLGKHNLVKQDIIFTHNIDIQSDIYFLPIRSSSIDKIFMIDVLHHLGKPWDLFTEAFRVLKTGGILILVEPYRSYFSYPVYKIFHNEPILLKKNYKIGVPILTDDPTSANNGIPTDIFLSKGNSKYLEYLLRDKFKLENEITFSDFISFFATGGLNRDKSLIKNKVYDYLLKLENKIPQHILRLIGSRMIVKLKKQ
jgi:SAM-dependent methyltransferase